MGYGRWGLVRLPLLKEWTELYRNGLNLSLNETDYPTTFPSTLVSGRFTYGLTLTRKLEDGLSVFF